MLRTLWKVRGEIPRRMHVAHGNLIAEACVRRSEGEAAQSYLAKRILSQSEPVTPLDVPISLDVPIQLGES